MFIALNGSFLLEFTTGVLISTDDIVSYFSDPALLRVRISTCDAVCLTHDTGVTNGLYLISDTKLY